MNREEAKEYWTARYEAARKWDDPHWEASERKEHRRYVDALNMAIEALQAPEIVRCKDCEWYEPAHILHNDGTKTYVDDDAKWVTADVGVNIGGQCIHHVGLKISCTAHNREDPEDYENIVIFRDRNDFCSYGDRKEQNNE